MKKTISFALVWVLMLVLFSGCATQSIDLSYTPRTDVVDLNSTDAYTIGYEDQFFYPKGAEFFTSTETGFYYFADCFLFFYDLETKQSHILCSRTDCDHTEQSCDAFFDPFEFYYDYGMCYYNNALYFLGKSSASRKGVSLYAVSSDGAERTEVIRKLFSVDNFGDIGQLILHREHLFYILKDDATTASIYSFHKDLKKPEKIYTYDKGEGGFGIIRLNVIGEYLYFQEEATAAQMDKGISSQLIRCNYITGESEVIVDAVNYGYMVIGDKIFYLLGPETPNLYIYDIAAKTTQTVVLAYNANGLSYDGNYLYVTDHHSNNEDAETVRIQVLEVDTCRAIDTIPIPRKEFADPFFGDSNSFLWQGFEFVDSKYKPAIKRYDKAKIGTGDYESECLYIRPDETNDTDVVMHEEVVTE